MTPSQNRSTIVFAAILCLLIILATSQWVPYDSISGTLPSSVYPFTFRANDVLKATLSWPSSVDMDLYIYPDNVNFMQRSGYLDREFSGNLNP